MSQAPGAGQPGPIALSAADDRLNGLLGQGFRSEMEPGVVYWIDQHLEKGDAGMAVPFVAWRRGRDGDVAVVVKVLRPSYVRRLGDRASLVVRKEAVALGRLNEQVPPTPFVVRLFEPGEVPVMLHDEHGGQTAVSLPWIAVEYVPGGPLGNTLTRRVKRSLEGTGSGFDAARAAHAIDCIAQGLAAVHEVGVIHRDLTPHHVLCAGTGSEEVFKISDFGVARPRGFAGTFGGAKVGTPGFAAPELISGDENALGTWTDVFSFSSIIFYLLTGELMFPSQSDVLATIQSSKRRSILDTQGLSPALRAQPHVCKSIDMTLQWGSAGNPDARLTEAIAVSAMIAPHLKTVALATSRTDGGPPRRRISLKSHLPPKSADRATPPEKGRWTVLFQGGTALAGGQSRVFRSVAWDGATRALAATDLGLMFWNGSAWDPAGAEGIASPTGIRFVRRIGAGRWLMGGDDPDLYVYTTGGAAERVVGPPVQGSFEKLAGSLDDVAVLQSAQVDGTLALHTYVTQRWLRSYPLHDLASITGLARVDDARWLVTGRKREGGAYAALYSALDWELTPIESPNNIRAWLTAVGSARKAEGWATGPEGAVLHWSDGRARFERLSKDVGLPAVSIDPYGRPWAAGLGHIWMRESSGWRCVWEDPAWRVPIVSLFLDTSGCVAMSADGAILEGRTARGPVDETSAPA